MYPPLASGGRFFSCFPSTRGRDCASGRLSPVLRPTQRSAECHVLKPGGPP
jgi:hypothetical protein